MTPITTNIPAIVTPGAHLATKRNFLITAALFVQEATKSQFYAGPVGTAPVSVEGQRAEALYNVADSKVRLSAQFAATINALTGDTVRDFSPTGYISWQVGMVVTPVVPAYRERSDDGYTVGQNYIVTNASTGRARGLDNMTVGYLNSKNGYGVQPMSQLNDEWAQVTDQPTIEALIDGLTTGMGTKFVDGLLADDGRSLLWVAEKLAE
jgi:hypothetical protein